MGHELAPIHVVHLPGGVIAGRGAGTWALEKGTAEFFSTGQNKFAAARVVFWWKTSRSGKLVSFRKNRLSCPNRTTKKTVPTRVCVYSLY